MRLLNHPSESQNATQKRNETTTDTAITQTYKEGDQTISDPHLTRDPERATIGAMEKV